ncbi:MAG: glycine cleavage system protein GcvH [Gammaproteobacteria bacterium]|nr:MAG: glycine cleavage system protein GcvH [Gammaproteobacteria bacterium]
MVEHEAPQELRYTRDHAWVMLEDDGTLTVGLTYYAQTVMGEMVFVETPAIEAILSVGDPCGVVESVKDGIDIYAPVNGSVTDSNPNLKDEPDMVNSDPYGDGWIYKMEPEDEGDIEELLDADEYAAFLAGLEDIENDPYAD